MIDWSVVQIGTYLGLIVGSPAVFFRLVEKKKMNDSAEANEKFYKVVEKEMKAMSDASSEQTQKLREKLKETERLLKEKTEQWEKIKPYLKYLREPAKTPSQTGNFSDDNV